MNWGHGLKSDDWMACVIEPETMIYWDTSFSRQHLEKFIHLFFSAKKIDGQRIGWPE
jgi:hypothetical protein